MSTLFSSTTKISNFQKRGGWLSCVRSCYTRGQDQRLANSLRPAAAAGTQPERAWRRVAKHPWVQKKMKPKTGDALVCIAQKLAARLRLQNLRNYMPLEPGACAPLARLTTREKVSCVRTRYTRELSPNFRTFSCVEKPARNRFPGRRGDAARRDCKAGCAAATIWPRV